MAQPLKPWLSIQDQIDRLQRRGMQIAEEEAATQWLSAVGYYRLSGYWYPFREMDPTGQGCAGADDNDVFLVADRRRKVATHHLRYIALRANPEGWPDAIEEILRYDTTGQLAVRIATEHIDIRGYPVRAGETIFLLVGGANRDPAVFEHPDTFDTTRANAREHISFGRGVHACLGATLARMELHIGLQSLFERFPQLTLAGEPTFNDSIGLHGFTHLPVSLRATKAIAP